MWNKNRRGGGGGVEGCKKKLKNIKPGDVYQNQSISCGKKKMRIVKNYIIAKKKVAKVARFSRQHFLPATISAHKVLNIRMKSTAT